MSNLLRNLPMQSLSPLLVLPLCFAASLRAETLYERHRQEIDAAAKLIDEIIHHPRTPHFFYHVEVREIHALPDGTHEVLLKPSSAERWEDGQTVSKDQRPVAMPEQLRWVWPEKTQPVPVVVGMMLWARVDKDGTIRAWQYLEGNIVAIRCNPPGSIEIVLRPMETLHLLRITPRRIDISGYFVQWTDRHGLNVSRLDFDGGGPEETDFEPSRVPRAGWKIDNLSGERVVPGRNGWKSWKSVYDAWKMDGGWNETQRGLRNLLTLISPSQWLPTQENRAAAQRIEAPAASRTTRERSPSLTP